MKALQFLIGNISRVSKLLLFGSFSVCKNATQGSNLDTYDSSPKQEAEGRLQRVIAEDLSSASWGFQIGVCSQNQTGRNWHDKIHQNGIKVGYWFILFLFIRENLCIFSHTSSSNKTADMYWTKMFFLSYFLAHIVFIVLYVLVNFLHLRVFLSFLCECDQRVLP